MKKLYLVILVILGVVIMALPGAAQIGSVPCEEGGKTRIYLPDDSVPVQNTETSVSYPAAPAGQDGRDGLSGHPGRDGKNGAHGLSGQNGHDGQTIIKVIYVGGRQIGLNRHGKVVSMTQRRQTLRRDIHKEYRRSGVVSRSFVEARDNVVLGAANTYTNQAVGAVSTRAWIAIGLSILALIVAAFAWRRRPAWRPVHY